MINLQGVEGKLSWFYILNRKIEGDVLANILNLDSTTLSPTWTDNALTGEFDLDGLPTIRPCDGIQPGKRSGSHF